jgi:hypothetical protein
MNFKMHLKNEFEMHFKNAFKYSYSFVFKRERERTVNVFDYSSQSVTRSRLEGS